MRKLTIQFGVRRELKDSTPAAPISARPLRTETKQAGARIARRVSRDADGMERRRQRFDLARW